MIEILFNGETLILRLAKDSDVSELRSLINSAYKELLDQGLNYTATYQDEEKTRERISTGRAFVLLKKQQIIATILFKKDNFFTKKNTAYVGQFAIAPEFKKNGLGTILMDYCEQLAQKEGFDGIQLDTAIPAKHLVRWYLKRGYQIVGEIHWEGKTYNSYMFEKIFLK